MHVAVFVDDNEGIFQCNSQLVSEMVVLVASADNQEESSLVAN